VLPFNNRPMYQVTHSAVYRQTSVYTAWKKLRRKQCHSAASELRIQKQFTFRQYMDTTA
jgi:hypothetical protein